jgi:hypothetical protein
VTDDDFMAIFGIFLASCIIVIATISYHVVWTSSVTHGKVFKLYDATYQCTKINELKADE